jgi:hypothetical protein
MLRVVRTPRTTWLPGAHPRCCANSLVLRGGRMSQLMVPLLATTPVRTIVKVVEGRV